MKSVIFALLVEQKTTDTPLGRTHITRNTLMYVTEHRHNKNTNTDKITLQQ